MKRILIGLVAVAALAAGGWFGLNLYVQHRATAEVEAAFERIRTGSGKASHGKVAFERSTRTLTVEDISIEPGQQPLAHIKIASVRIANIKAGTGQADDSRFSADSIDVSGMELALAESGPAKAKATYKIPHITVKDYSGPIAVQGAPAGGSPIDMYRFVLEQYAGITAASIVIPTLAITIDAGSGAPGSGEVAYSGVAIQNVAGGKVEALKADRATFALDVLQAGKPGKLTGEVVGLVVDDFDAKPMVAALDPQETNDDSFRTVYRKISIGPYVVTSTQGVRMQIDGITIDDVAVQPSKFRPAGLLTLLPAKGSAVPTPAQSREIIEKFADFYDGLRVGKVEVGNLSVQTPQGTVTLRAIRYDQDEFALEGLDVPAPQGQFKMERFALKSFSAASLMRWMARTANPGQTPSRDQMVGLFRVLGGAAIKGVVSPYKNTRKLITIDTLSLDWGQLVGSIPSRAHIVARMVTPTDPTDPRQLALIAAGLDKLPIDLDIGAAWTEASGVLALSPATIDIGNLVRVQASVALGNVPRGMFSTDPAMVLGQAAQIEAGAIELSLRDNGGVDLAVAHFARTQNVSRDVARQAIINSIRANRARAASVNPDAGAAVDALARFVEIPGQTLAVKLTPLGKVPVMQVMGLLNTEPLTALAQFRIEASTGL